MSWLFPYANNFLQTEKIVFSYLTTKKDSRVWLGSIEALLALAYIRFRPGSKFRLQKGFRIINDHSHPIKVGDYKFNLQGLKRYCLGGSSIDLANFKTPLFYSHLILKHIKPENREVLLKLAMESINNLIETYEKDIFAMEVLNDMRAILEIQLEGCQIELHGQTNRQQYNEEDDENYGDGNHQEQPFDLDHALEELRINRHIHDDYLDSPLTKKNQEIWLEETDILNKIADLYRRAYQSCLDGRNYDPYLAEIREYSEAARSKLEDFLMEIPKGHV